MTDQTPTIQQQNEIFKYILNRLNENFRPTSNPHVTFRIIRPLLNEYIHLFYEEPKDD